MNDAANLRGAIGSGDLEEMVLEFERKVDSLIEVYEGRELVLKGLEEA